MSVKREKLTFYDGLKIEDHNRFLRNSVIQKDYSNLPGNKGFVRLIKDGKPITDFMPNLVVGIGRRFVAQALFDKKNAADPQLWDYNITHFGLGSGGSTIVGSNVTLNGPDVCDEDMYVPLALAPGDSTYLTSPGDIPNSVAPTANVCKRIESDGSISVVENTAISCTNTYYTWVKCECLKASGEPTDIAAGESVRIDEACLYYTNYGSVAPASETVYTFAHICFAPKWIEKESELLIEWYILA